MTDVVTSVRPDQASTVEPTRNAVTKSNHGGDGTAWSNPRNVFTDDNVNATANLASGVFTNYLFATRFNMNIHRNADIRGVTFTVAKSGAVGIEDRGVHLVVNNVVKSGVAQRNNNIAGGWPTTDTTVSYGGITDTWDQVLTPDVVNSDGFGLAIAGINNVASGDATAYLDHVSCTVEFGFGGSNIDGIRNGGFVTMSTNKFGFSHRTGPTINENVPSLSGVLNRYEDRLDNPRYYQGDTST